LPVLVPMLVGGIPLGLVTAGIVYYLTRSTVEAYQAKRRARVAKLAAIHEDGSDKQSAIAELEGPASGGSARGIDDRQT